MKNKNVTEYFLLYESAYNEKTCIICHSVSEIMRAAFRIENNRYKTLSLKMPFADYYYTYEYFNARHEA
jgi:cbb3-type cytochrome oxidase cytochrome c subunit